MSNRFPASISWCQVGWKSTASRRLPTRSCVRRTGGFSLASRPHSCASPPQNAPASPARFSASTSGALSRNRLRFSRGGTWLNTSWVASLRGAVMDMWLLGDRSKTELHERGDKGLIVDGVGLGQDLADRADEGDRNKLGVLRGERAIQDPLPQ